MPESNRSARQHHREQIGGDGQASERDRGQQGGPKLPPELAATIASRRAFYEVRAKRVEPVGLVYLWPETN